MLIVVKEEAIACTHILARTLTILLLAMDMSF